MRLVIGISGASGIIYGVRLLEVLKEKIETHLTFTPIVERVLRQETHLKKHELINLANYYYQIDDLSASISSGSFLTAGMVIIPCSMKTIGGIACGYSDNLLLRAADVTLKENRKLIIVPRETPLRKIHLENMVKLSNEKAIILPAMPGFYFNPKTIDDIINHIVGKVLDILEIKHDLYKRWGSNS